MLKKCQCCALSDSPLPISCSGESFVEIVRSSWALNTAVKRLPELLPSSAVVILASPKTAGHFLNDKSMVTMIEVCS